MIKDRETAYADAPHPASPEMPGAASSANRQTRPRRVQPRTAGAKHLRPLLRLFVLACGGLIAAASAPMSLFAQRAPRRDGPAAAPGAARAGKGAAVQNAQRGVEQTGAEGAQQGDAQVAALLGASRSIAPQEAQVDALERELQALASHPDASVAQQAIAYGSRAIARARSLAGQNGVAEAQGDAWAAIALASRQLAAFRAERIARATLRAEHERKSSAKESRDGLPDRTRDSALEHNPLELPNLREGCGLCETQCAPLPLEQCLAAPVVRWATERAPDLIARAEHERSAAKTAYEAGSRRELRVRMLLQAAVEEARRLEAEQETAASIDRTARAVESAARPLMASSAASASDGGSQRPMTATSSQAQTGAKDSIGSLAQRAQLTLAFATAIGLDPARSMALEHAIDAAAHKAAPGAAQRALLATLHEIERELPSLRAQRANSSTLGPEPRESLVTPPP